MMRVVRRPKSGNEIMGFLSLLSLELQFHRRALSLIRRLIRLRRGKKVEERKKRQNKQNKYPSNYVALIYRSCFFHRLLLLQLLPHRKKSINKNIEQPSQLSAAVNGFSCISRLLLQHRFRACYQNGRRRRCWTNVSARNCSSAERNGLICSILWLGFC